VKSEIDELATEAFDAFHRLNLTAPREEARINEAIALAGIVRALAELCTRQHGAEHDKLH
jgi:hypothetical protein